MFENIFETVIKGSNTIFLDVNEDDYFTTYDGINKDNAEEITRNYFEMKQKDGRPRVLDINHDKFTHTVKITVDVNPNENLPKPLGSVPDSLNILREH